MQQGKPRAFRFRRPLSLVTLEDRLQIVWIAVQSYWIMKAQAEQLPSVLLPVGRTEITTFSKVQIFDSFVQKRITFSSEAWPPSRCQLMENIYAASKDCPFLIHAQQPPHASQNGKEYIVDLEPVGQPVLSKHFDQKPQSSGELRKSIRYAPLLASNQHLLAMTNSHCQVAASQMNSCNMGSVVISAVDPSTAKLSSGMCIAFKAYVVFAQSLCVCRCILHALKVLHQAGYAHTDLRWENVILQHADQWVLIDLEFACVLNSVPFTPVGEPLPCVLVYELHFLSACLQNAFRKPQSKESKMSLQPVVSRALSQNICILSVEMVLHEQLDA